jgi:broad specificity phosphatase PhoE
MQLILVRHAQTIIDPEVMSTEWQLSDEGRSSAKMLASNPMLDDLDAIYSSSQAKAIETADILAGRHGLTNQTAQGLAELSSVTRGFIDDYANTIRKLYQGEIERINNGETLEEALHRFNLAIETIVSQEKNAEKIAIVSHANVLSLFSAQYCNKDAINLHNTIAMPDIALLEWNSEDSAFRQFWSGSSS